MRIIIRLALIALLGLYLRRIARFWDWSSGHAVLGVALFVVTTLTVALAFLLLIAATLKQEKAA